MDSVIKMRNGHFCFYSPGGARCSIQYIGGMLEKWSCHYSLFHWECQGFKSSGRVLKKPWSYYGFNSLWGTRSMGQCSFLFAFFRVQLCVTLSTGMSIGHEMVITVFILFGVLDTVEQWYMTWNGHYLSCYQGKLDLLSYPSVQKFVLCI